MLSIAIVGAASELPPLSQARIRRWGWRCELARPAHAVKVARAMQADAIVLSNVRDPACQVEQLRRDFPGAALLVVVEEESPREALRCILAGAQFYGRQQGAAGQRLVTAAVRVASRAASAGAAPDRSAALVGGRARRP